MDPVSGPIALLVKWFTELGNADNKNKDKCNNQSASIKDKTNIIAEGKQLGIPKPQPVIKRNLFERTVVKLAYNIYYSFLDAIFAPKLFQEHPYWNLNLKLTEYKAKQLDNADISIWSMVITQDKTDIQVLNIPPGVKTLNYQDVETKLIDMQKSISPVIRILIPILIPGKFPITYPHIVLVAVDKNEKKIAYYDSQGVPAKNRDNINTFLNKMLIQLSALDVDKKDKIWEVIEHPHEDQKDPNNCGVFVMHAMEELADTSKKLGNFIEEPFKGDILVKRKEMGLKVVKAFNLDPPTTTLKPDSNSIKYFDDLDD